MADFDEPTDEGRRPSSRPGFDREDERERLRRIEAAAVEWSVDRAVLFGHRDRDRPGRLSDLELVVKTHTERLGHLETWRTGVTAKMAIAIAIGTPIAGVITALLVRWIGGH